MHKRLVFGLGGATSLLLGMVLVLSWWPWVVGIFKGCVGMVLAVAGMILLYLAKE